MQITFKVNRPVLHRVINYRANILSAPAPDISKQAHEAIEKIVTANLLSEDSSTRDPSATKRSNLNLASQVANNITSSVKVLGKKTLGGTGKISYMDKNDPLRKMGRRLKDNQVRLWRILEHGVQPFSNSLMARSLNKPMVFWWRKKGVLFIGKSSNWFAGRVSGGPYKGQFAMIGRRPYDQPIKHPGQLGRFYWEKSMAEARNTFELIVRSGLRKRYAANR